MQTRLLSATLMALLWAVATPVLAQDAEDGAWVTFSGTVAEVLDEAFRVDYGDGLVTVGVRDTEAFPPGDLLGEGDHVTVYGGVDKRLYENATLRANSIYVEDLNTTFYVGDTGPGKVQPRSVRAFKVEPLEEAEYKVTGMVTDVGLNEFRIGSGDIAFSIDVSQLTYNPIDNLGFQQVDENDLVTVTGRMDRDIFEKRQLIAEEVITLGER